MAKENQEFYCRRAYERTVSFNNRLQRLINVFHCFDAICRRMLLSGVCSCLKLVIGEIKEPLLVPFQNLSLL